MPLSLGPYLAGLWRYTLAFNPTWGLYTRTPVGRSEEWRAPTWSWASATDKVTWWNNRPPLTRENFITVVDAGVIAIGDDVTGQIRSGELRIRGRGLTGMLFYCSSRHESTYRHQSLWRSPEISVTFSWGLRTLFVDLTSDKSDDHDVRSQVYWDYWIEGPGPHRVSDSSFILFFKIETVSRTGRDTTMNWLLLKCSTQDCEAFERIGLLEFRVPIEDSLIYSDE
jgi:hypothetical protein